MASNSANPSRCRLWPLSGPWQWLFRQRGNGLPDDTWVPVLLVESRIVSALLAELRRAGIPAYCTHFRRGWHIPPQPGMWCVWVGCSAHRRADEKLAAAVPRLVRSLYRRPTGPAGHR
jgi:hypothetical protein